MVQETFIRFCQRAGSYDAGRGPVRGWLFTMAKSVAVDIARRPSSRPFLPVEDFQLPPQYDSADEALTVFTVDQALDKLPPIYGEVMRLVRDGFTQSEIAGRLGRASFNHHLSSCRHCRSVVDEYGDIGAVIKTLPPHAEPSADLEDRTVAAMVAVLAGQRAKPAAHPADASAEDNTTRPYPVPKVHRAAEPETRVQPRRAPAAEPQAKVQPVPQLGPPAGPEARPGPPPPPAGTSPDGGPAGDTAVA